MPIVLQPVDQVAHAELAQRLACWAKTSDGFTDRDLIYQSCCVSPTGQTLGRWVVPEALCATYGPFNFTGNDGEVIPCPAPGSAEYLNFYIYDDDVHDIDPNTCVESTLAAPTGLASPTQGPDSVDLTWNAVAGAEQYIVRWSIAGANNWTELPPTTQLAATVTGLADETSYDFQVQAVAAGFVDSPWSATLTQATTSLGTLAAPTGLSNPSSTGTTMDLTWNAVTNATGYTVEWSPTGQNNWTSGYANTTSYTVTGLTIGTSYDVRVKATAPDWTDSAWSTQIIGSTEQQLATPTGMASPSQTGTTVDLTWTAVPNATTYTVRWSPAGAGTWTEIAPVGIPAATVTGLVGGTSYDFEVQAHAEDYVDSAWSATFNQPTAALLATPVLSSPSQTQTTVDLSWDAVPNATSYTVQWKLTTDGSWTALPDTSGTTQTVSGLTADTSYTFRVIAHATGWADSAWSNELVQSTQPVPVLGTPTGLTSPSQTDTTVDLSWAAVTDATAYVVRWSPAGAGTWTQLDPIATTSDTVTGLTAATSYDFQVKAQAAGFTDSDWSTTLTQSTAPLLITPSNLATGAATTTTMPLSWDAVTNATQYVEAWSPTGQNTWTELTPVATTSDTVTGLSPGTGYDFRVKATAPGFADSPWSTVVTDSTMPEPLAAPTGLDGTGSATSTTQIVQWNAVTNATNYVVRWSPAGAGTWTELPPTADTNDTVGGLSPSTSYDYQVKATGAGFADSPWSTTWTGSTTATPQLSAPDDLASPSQTDTTVDLTWTAIVDADTYVVRWSPAGAGTWTELAPVGATADTVTGLTASTSYDFQVKAQGSGWLDSPYSASFTQSTASATQLAVPQNMASPSQTGISVDLTWDAVTDATNYVVRHSPQNANTWTENAPVATTSDTVTGLITETTYDFSVKATAAGWTDSDWSPSFIQSTTA